MPKHHLLRALLTIALAASVPPARAAEPTLRIGLSDSDGPPIVILERSASNKGMISGLSKDLGDALAAAIHRQPEYIILSRNRVEDAITSGKVDIICNSNPKWFSHPEQFGWTREFYMLVERIFSLKAMPDITKVDQLEGKHIGTIIGYHYASLEPMWQAGRATRVDETRIDLLMRSLMVKMTDVAIESELEFAVWAKAKPHEARALKMHPIVFTSTPTMCAVSPKGNVSVKELDAGIDTLKKSGQIKDILQNYQWH